MSWKFSNNKAIFQQIVDIIIKDIVSGKYKEGEKLPSVRDLSLEAGVNPNTVQRAYMEVEQKGLIYTKRGDGRYVSEDVSLIKSQADDNLEKAIKSFIGNLREMGFSDKEILNAVSLELKGKENSI